MPTMPAASTAHNASADRAASTSSAPPHRSRIVSPDRGWRSCCLPRLGGRFELCPPRRPPRPRSGRVGSSLRRRPVAARPVLPLAGVRVANVLHLHDDGEDGGPTSGLLLPEARQRLHGHAAHHGFVTVALEALELVAQRLRGPADQFGAVGLVDDALLQDAHLAHHPAVLVQGDDGDADALRRQPFAVAQHRAADIAHAQSVDEDHAGAEGLPPGHHAVVQHDGVAVLADEGPVRFEPGLLGDALVRHQGAVLAVHRHGVAPPRRRSDTSAAAGTAPSGRRAAASSRNASPCPETRSATCGAGRCWCWRPCRRWRCGRWTQPAWSASTWSCCGGGCSALPGCWRRSRSPPRASPCCATRVPAPAGWPSGSPCAASPSWGCGASRRATPTLTRPSRCSTVPPATSVRASRGRCPPWRGCGAAWCCCCPSACSACWWSRPRRRELWCEPSPRA